MTFAKVRQHRNYGCCCCCNRHPESAGWRLPSIGDAGRAATARTARSEKWHHCTAKVTTPLTDSASPGSLCSHIGKEHERTPRLLQMQPSDALLRCSMAVKVSETPIWQHGNTFHLALGQTSCMIVEVTWKLKYGTQCYKTKKPYRNAVYWCLWHVFSLS